MPVYLLFTKADLLAGFTEFFDDLDRDAARPGLGHDVSRSTPERPAPAAAFEAEFRCPGRRLNDAAAIDALQAERGADRRALIAGFPAQVASLEQPLTDFIQEAFGGSRLERAPMLRGVYFTSGTQEGTPIDRLTGSLARAFGLDQRRLPSLRPEQGRSYFLGRLLRDVDLRRGDAGLASRPALRAAACCCALALSPPSHCVLRRSPAPCCGPRGTVARDDDRQRRQQALERLRDRRRKACTLDPVSDADLPRLVPLLDQARALPSVDHPAATGGGCWSFGLSQDGEAGGRRHARVYRHALDNALLPRLIWRLEAQMRGRLNQPDFLYEATRVYLMLRQRRAARPRLVHEWMMLDWQADLSRRGARADARRRCCGIWTRCWRSRCRRCSWTASWSPQARSTFSRVSLAQRVYSRIRPSAAAQALPPWRPRDALGPGRRRRVRARLRQVDGRRHPRLLTIDGFHRVLLPGLVRGGEKRRVRELGAWRSGRARSERPADAARSSAM